MQLPSFFLCLTLQFCAAFASDAFFLKDEYINQINAEQNLWQAGRNFDADTPLSEVKKLMGGMLEGRNYDPSRVKNFDARWPEKKKIPKKFDARKKWHKKCPKIAQVLDQGFCGSCWAISSTQAFTDRYCIATRGKHQMRLATANVLSCCENCGFGCNGGWENLAWEYFSEHGLPTGGVYNSSEGCQPYNIQSPCKRVTDNSPYGPCPDFTGDTPPCPGKCTNEKYSKSLDKDYRFAKSAYRLNATDEVIMKDIMTHGPITVSFTVMTDFMSYKSGVYEPMKDTKPLGGHVMKVIGWGEEKNTPYWLIMNSWNEYWGDHGLIKMKRNSVRLGLEFEMWAAEPRYGRVAEGSDIVEN